MNPGDRAASEGVASFATPRSAVPSEATIPFRRDEDASFPIGGAVLLVALIVIAAWAWWHARALAPNASRRRATWLDSWFARRRGLRATGELAIMDAVVVEGGLRVAVVSWPGGQVLVGVGASGTPVVLDRLPSESGHPAHAEGVPCEPPSGEARP